MSSQKKIYRYRSNSNWQNLKEMLVIICCWTFYRISLRNGQIGWSKNKSEMFLNLIFAPGVLKFPDVHLSMNLFSFISLGAHGPFQFGNWCSSVWGRLLLLFRCQHTPLCFSGILIWMWHLLDSFFSCLFSTFSPF